MVNHSWGFGCCYQFGRSAVGAALISLLLSGCSSLYLPPSVEPEPTVVHVVRYPGETLGLLSMWYTGTPQNWKVIQGANPALDVRKIRIGQTIYIPERLVKNRKNLTATLVKNIEVKLQGSIHDKKLQWREADSADDVEYPYPVKTIRGCEGLSNSLSGLNECANRVGNEWRKG